MNHNDFPARATSLTSSTRSSLRSAILGFAVLTAACAEPTAPAVSNEGQGPAFAVAAASFQLSAELGGVRRPGEHTSRARGSLTLQFTQSIGDPNVFELTWQGTIRNPERETFLRGAIDFIGDPGILPADLQAELAGIALIGDPNLAKRFDFAGATQVSSRLASVMRENAGAFRVTLYTSEHPNGAIVGACDGSV